MISLVDRDVSINVYEMYIEFGRKPGFWLWRISWGNTIAKVTSMAELKGRHPFYNGAEVRADLYDIHSGDLKEKDAIIPVPGTSKTWRMVQPPSWSNDKSFDPLNEWTIIYLPFELNKKAKSYGARWSRILTKWVIRADNQKHLAKAEEAGLLTPPPVPTSWVYFDVPFSQRIVANGVRAKWEVNLLMWSLPTTQTEEIEKIKQQGIEIIEEKDLEGYLASPMVGFDIPSWSREVTSDILAKYDRNTKLFMVKQSDTEAIEHLKNHGFEILNQQTEDVILPNAMESSAKPGSTCNSASS